MQCCWFLSHFSPTWNLVRNAAGPFDTFLLIRRPSRVRSKILRSHLILEMQMERGNEAAVVFFPPPTLNCKKFQTGAKSRVLRWLTPQVGGWWWWWGFENKSCVHIQIKCPAVVNSALMLRIKTQLWSVISRNVLIVIGSSSRGQFRRIWIWDLFTPPSVLCD